MSETELEVRMRNMDNVLTRIEQKLDTALTDINDHEKRLRCLEGKPAKRWDTIVTLIIELLVAGFVGYLIAK